MESRAFTSRLTADGKEIPKKKTHETRITLIGPDNSVSITDLKNAQNVSLRRELKLVKVQDVDSKTRRCVYKLVFLKIWFLVTETVCVKRFTFWRLLGNLDKFPFI